MRYPFSLVAGVVAVAVACGGAVADRAQADAARAVLQNTEGQTVGTVALEQTPHGVLIRADIDGLPPGTHAFHIHQTGVCEPPFTSAGGHYNPTGAQHGFQNPEGYHAGDLPNIHVPEDGALVDEMFTDRVSLDPDAAATLFDDDGSAIVIHQGADDYATDPAGGGGDRIACGVITPAQ